MQPLQSPYVGLVELYTHIIRRESVLAAEEIGNIRAEWGARGAYLAAFVLLQFKPQIDIAGAAPEQSLYASCVGGTVELLPVIHRLIEIYLANRA